AAIDAGYLIFTPAADASGAGYDSFDFTVNDGTGDSAGSYTMTINVTSVNDAPVFTVGDGIVSTDFAAGDDLGQSVTVQSDGKILVAGSARPDTVRDLALVRYNANGSLDTTFGSDGWATAEYGSWTQDRGYCVTVQNDGKILVAGTTNNGSTYDFTLVRFNADGTFDNSFDGDGFLTTPIGSADDHGYSVTVQSDGKILVAGDSHNGSDYDFALVRYNTDGSLDTTFDSDGILTTDFGSGDDVGNSVTVQSDGKILVAGGGSNGSNYDFALIRYNADGSLDTSLDSDGILTTAIGSNHDVGQSVTVQGDGKILVAGHSHDGSFNDFALTRYNADGSLDTSFDSDGILTTAIGSTADAGYSVKVQSDGKILVAGETNNGSNRDFALVRYNADGSLDSTFDSDGILTTAIGSGHDYGRSVILQSDGRILVAGESDNGTDFDFVLTRYNADGSLDSTFDTLSTLDGTPTFPQGGAAVVLDADVDISDVELDALNSGAGNYNGATLTLLRNGGANAEDEFSNSGLLDALTQGGSLIYNGTTIGTVTTNSAGTLLLTFDANATSALVDSTLQSIAYANSSDTPPASAQIDWSFDDGNTGSQGT
ncbi:MAG: hypothetical protein GY722_04985, partial [bacterium]|nr:hypothetical protein [bacterium]